MTLENFYSYLILAAVIGILTLGFGSLLDIIRGHDGKEAEPEAAPEPEPAPAPEPEE
jgi:hypothetical protein